MKLANNYLKILQRFCLLIAIMLIFNWIYSSFFYVDDIQKYSPVIHLVNKVVAEHNDIIYVGESSNNTCRNDDLDRRSISSFIGAYFPEIKMGDITKEASHAGIFFDLLNAIPENSQIKTVVITMNLRSFNADWINSSLETALQKSMVLLKKEPPLVDRFLLAFKGYDHKSAQERSVKVKLKMAYDILKFPVHFKYATVYQWDNGMAAIGIKNPDGTRNNLLTELACHYIKTYAFQIDTMHNPRIKDFDRIVALAHQRNWHLVFNIMAENVEKADSLVGKELVFLMKQNRDLLKKRYQKGNVLLVDNLELVPDAEFIDQAWTTEHYAEKGRKMIAKNVALCLSKIFPDKYKEVIYRIDRPSEFFNNCEGSILWGQLQTLSADNFFSGKKSSKVGQKQDFSLTFEYPVKQLPDSLNYINIDFQIFQNVISDQAKLVIEISGDQVSFQWNALSVKDFTKVLQRWNLVHYKFLLPPDFYKAHLIKIYDINPGNNLLYIDDLHVKFMK